MLDIKKEGQMFIKMRHKVSCLAKFILITGFLFIVIAGCEPKHSDSDHGGSCGRHFAKGSDK